MPFPSEGVLADQTVVRVRQRDGVLGVLSTVALFGFWFALPFTRYRIGDLGLSEIFGLLLLLQCVLHRRFVLAKEAMFIFAAHALFTVSTLTGIVYRDGITGVPLRDVVAVTYAVLAAVAAANLMALDRRFFRAGCLGVVSCVAIFSSGLLSSLISGSTGGLWFVEDPTISSFAEPMEGGTFPMLPRYIGFSQNPNQLAFYLVFALFFVMSAGMAGQLKISRGWRWLLLAMIAVTMLSTQSDAAMLAFATGLALLAFKRIFKTWTASSALAVYLLACSSALIVWKAWEWGLGEDGGGGRFLLWIAALRVIDEARGIGFGYGGHISEANIWYESHSTFLDFLLSGGLIGGLFLMLIVFLNLRSYLFGRRHYFASTTLVILVFCLTYSAFRHPIFWFALLLPRVFAVLFRYDAAPDPGALVHKGRTV